MAKHLWRRMRNGEVDIFGLDVDYHNGPICVACGEAFCHHCEDVDSLECEAILDVNTHDTRSALIEASTDARGGDL